MVTLKRVCLIADLTISFALISQNSFDFQSLLSHELNLLKKINLKIKNKYPKKKTFRNIMKWFEDRENDDRKGGNRKSHCGMFQRSFLLRIWSMTGRRR